MELVEKAIVSVGSVNVNLSVLVFPLLQVLHQRFLLQLLLSHHQDLATAQFVLNLLNLCTGTPIKETRSALDVQSHFLVQVTVLLYLWTLYPSCLLCSGAPTKEIYMFNFLHNGIHPIAVTSSYLFRVGMIIVSHNCFVSALGWATSVCVTAVERSLISKPSHQMTCVFSMRSGVHIPRQFLNYLNPDLEMHTTMQTLITFWLIGQFSPGELLVPDNIRNGLTSQHKALVSNLFGVYF